MPVFDHFSLAAPFYDRIFKYHRLERLTKLLNLTERAPVLDAAGGTGRIAAEFTADTSPVVVADLCYSMLRQSVIKPGLNPVNCLIEQLPFANGSFSGIIMVDALHHVIDQKECARELWRVLRAGGRIVIEEPDIGSIGVKIVALFEKLMFMRSHFLNPQEMVRLFNNECARVTIDQDRFYVAVIVEKPAELNKEVD